MIMAKKTAILAVDPVNGFGLFQYLEAFYENQIPYKVFAVADSVEIKSNSGLKITADDVVANLKSKADEYDALVFACGDAIPKFADNAGKQYNLDMLEVMREFAAKGKLMIGHCAAAMLYENLGLIDGRKVAAHPYIKSVGAITKGIVTDAPAEIDGNFYTAQTENTLNELMPELIKVLK